MDLDETEERIARLTGALDEAVAILQEMGADRWAAWLAADARHVRAGDAHGLRHVLGAFGGMGSLNDVLGPDRLRELLSVIYGEAATLLHEVEGP